MARKVIRTSKRRKRFTVRRAGAPWQGVRVKIEDLPAFRARWGLRVVGGDPDLDGEPWRPVVYVVEV